MAARWWAFAAVARLFYPFTGEMCHAARRLDGPSQPPRGSPYACSAPAEAGPPDPLASSLRASFRHSVVEGLLWGAAVWMKPHIVPMALTVWLLTAWRLTARHPKPGRAVAVDLFGNLLGGIVVGLAGVCWLFSSGAWNDFCEVFREWNPYYVRLTQIEFDSRMKEELFWFPPWSLGLILTVPLAVLSILDLAPWSRPAPRSRRRGEAPGPLGRWLPWQLWDRQAGTDARFARGVLAGFYLTWAAQAFFIQREFHYVHVPETLLMFGVWASHRWAWAFVGGALARHLPADAGRGRLQHQSSRGTLWFLSPKTRERYLPRHLTTDPVRLELWPKCWRLNMPDAERYAMWDMLRLHPQREASIGWVELAELAEFFRAQGVKDGEIIGWFNSPHAVCLLLDVKPGFRYMHVYTAIAIDYNDTSNKIGRGKVMQELRAATGAKYVITDLRWVILAAGNGKQADYLGPPRNPPNDLLPVNSPCVREVPVQPADGVPHPQRQRTLHRSQTRHPHR